MDTEKFRRQLRQETEKWWTEGLIDAALYERLADRYQFHTLERDASNRFITILMGLGGVLLGLGVITFVAANWQDWSRSFKILLLLSLFISVNASGFYLWRRPTHKRFQKLGHGLLILGALILGANMALMSQMFHQSGNFYELLLVWGLGVTAMAFSLRLASLGCLALLLMGWGYTLGWATSIAQQDDSLWQFLILHMPLFTSFVFIPLAYWCRSRAVFALSSVVITVALLCNLKPFAGWSYGQLLTPGWLAVLAFVLPPALLWAFDRPMWHFSRSHHTYTPHPTPHIPHPFTPIARNIALVFLSVVFYIFAFRWMWQINSFGGYYPFYEWNWQPLIDAIVLSIFAGLGWLQLRHQFRRRWLQERAINTGTVAIMLFLTAAILLWHFEVGSSFWIATLGFNVLLFFLAIALVRDGLAMSDRSIFWGGMVLLVVSIMSRMLEYNTGLLLKSIVFVLCGVGVMLAGLWFERNIRPRNALSLSKSSPEGSG